MELEKSFLKIALCFSVNLAISWNLSPRQADSGWQPHGASVRAGRQSSREDVVFLPAQVADSNTLRRGVPRGPRDLSAPRDSKCSARRSLPSGVLRTHFAAFVLKTLASAVRKVHPHMPSRARARRPVERLPSAETAPGRRRERAASGGTPRATAVRLVRPLLWDVSPQRPLATVTGDHGRKTAATAGSASLR